MTETYKKYLYNQFREVYGFSGLPIRIYLKGKKKRTEDKKSSAPEDFDGFHEIKGAIKDDENKPLHNSKNDSAKGDRSEDNDTFEDEFVDDLGEINDDDDDMHIGYDS